MGGIPDGASQESALLLHNAVAAICGEGLGQGEEQAQAETAVRFRTRRCSSEDERSVEREVGAGLAKEHGRRG